MDDIKSCWELPTHLTGATAVLADDSVSVPAPDIDPHIRTQLAVADNPHLWLPSGFHTSLHIEHDHRVLTGPFVGPEVWALLWHITVSPWEMVDTMRNTLHAKHAEVHFVIGGRRGVKNPVVIQCLPLNQFGKGLVHLLGRPETNRTHVIQVEICAMPNDMANFKHYRALANLTWLLTHGNHPRIPVARKVVGSFASERRMSDRGFMLANGHTGHSKVPQNTHFDPTKQFDGPKLMRLIASAPHDL